MLDDRFWAKVDKNHPSGCWVWTASCNNREYGMFRPGGSAPKKLAHRLSFEDTYGPIPQGKLILHSCDNPRCVNPAHLRVGDHRENVADMDARKRRITNPAFGEASPQTDKTEQEIIAIRRDYVAGVPQVEIMESHQVSRAAFSDYVRGRSWAHILGKDGCPGIEALRQEAARRRRNAARINYEIAEEIRKRLSAGELGVNLAVEYGIHKATISDIRKRKIWALPTS